MKVNYSGKFVEIDVKKVSELGKISGLMFRTSKTQNLLFEFSKDVSMKIHSFFVFFSFLAIWVDEKNKLIEWKIVKPFTVAVSPQKNYRKLIEVPLNKKNTKIIQFFVGKERFK